MPFNTALTRQLGIRGMRARSPTSGFEYILTSTVPIVQGGMQWVGYAELASAVSNAGGLGLVYLLLTHIKYKTNMNTSSLLLLNLPPKTCARRFDDAAK
jgi:hypothetical protein